MNADRHALNAALEFAAKQGQEIALLHDQMRSIQDENRDMRRRLRESRAALDGRDKGPDQCDAQPMSPIAPRQRNDDF